MKRKSDQLYYTINALILIACGIVTLYPLIYIFSSSLSSRDAVMGGKVWLWPVDFSLEGYRAVFNNADVLTGYANTLFYTVAGTLLNVVLTVMLAYPLSRKDLRLRNKLVFLVTFTMIFQGGMIPTYIVVRNLGLINTRWAVILPTALVVWNVIIARTFFQNNIPDELLEASRMDGCGDWRFLIQVVLPLSGALLAIEVLFYAVFHWNSFFQAFIYLSDSDLYPLQLILRQILLANKIDTQSVIDPELMAQKEGMVELLKFSLIIVASLPVIIVYPFVQKYFVKGVMIGAIKG